VTRRALIDTGPLVAFLNRRDRHHPWATKVLDSVEPPLRTCESVLSEACFLLRTISGGREAVLDLVRDRIVKVSFTLDAEVESVRRLIDRYSSVPMSLADACLVRMTELDPSAALITLDQDFRVYRRNGRQAIETISPWR
jgi:predicted nucleic acid-binding protein